jgi:hypothetical protein
MPCQGGVGHAVQPTTNACRRTLSIEIGDFQDTCVAVVLARRRR